MFFRKKPTPAKPPAGAKPASAKPGIAETPGYRGAERRKDARRANAGERRHAIRWEPGKGERRQSHGRRKTDSRWQHH